MTFIEAQPDPLHREGGKVKDHGPTAGAAARALRAATQDASGAVGDLGRMKASLTRYAGGLADDSQGIEVAFSNGGGNVQYVAATVRNLDNEEGRANHTTTAESTVLGTDIAKTITRRA